MAASRLSKENTDTAVPYLWNAPPPAARATPLRHVAPVDASHEEEIQAQYQRGYRDGVGAGKAAEADAAAQEISETVAGLANARLSLFRSAQGDMLRLAIAVARRILHREIMMSPDVLGGVISVALERIEENDLHTLRVHPSFVDRINEHLSGRISSRKLQVVADPVLPLGGCVFETQHGNVDAGIESQLSEIERGLADHLEVLR